MEVLGEDGGPKRYRMEDPKGAEEVGRDSTRSDGETFKDSTGGLP